MSGYFFFCFVFKDNVASKEYSQRDVTFSIGISCNILARFLSVVG